MPDHRVPREESTAASRAVVAVAVVAALFVSAACWSWSARGSSPALTAPTAAPAQATVSNRSACMTFGLAVRRSEATISTVALLGLYPRRSDFTTWLPHEVVSLDAIVRRFPAADYRLVDVLSRVADASALVLAPDTGSSLRDRVVARADAVNAAHSACRTMAGFDTHRLQPVHLSR